MFIEAKQKTQWWNIDEERKRVRRRVKEDGNVWIRVEKWLKL